MRAPNREALLAILMAVAVVAGTRESQAADAPAAAPTQTDDGVHKNDKWRYDQTDDITGQPDGSTIYVVTRATPDELTVVQTTIGSGSKTTVFVFDRNWNIKADGNTEMTPHDGWGVDRPLTPGKEWRIQNTNKNLKTNYFSNEQTTNKVVGPEKVTIGGKDYNTIKVTSDVTWTKSDGSVNSAKATTWWSDDVHWFVKRSYESRVSGHLFKAWTSVLDRYTPFKQ